MGALIAGLVVFSLMVWSQWNGRVSPADVAILEALRPHDDPARPWGPWWLHEALADITALGSITVLGLLAVVTGGVLMRMRRGHDAAVLALGLMGGVALSEGLKALFARDRPPDLHRAVDTLNASFPSGHAILSTVFFISLGVVLARMLKGYGLSRHVMVAAVGVVLLVGWSRIYLGAHWPSDVLAGWGVGIAWAMLLRLVADRLDPPRITAW